MDPRTSRRLNDLLLLGGLVGLLILAFLLDTLRNYLLTGAESTSSQVKLFFLLPLMQLVMMLAALGLIWLFLIQRRIQPLDHHSCTWWWAWCCCIRWAFSPCCLSPIRFTMWCSIYPWKAIFSRPAGRLPHWG